ncbi:MAG TPA: hypothetical protein VMD99_07565 [Terriglobales bacterium]|nr:hypothetical protein [Terriglobales bacterium]
MRNFGVPFFLLAVAAAITLACGGSPSHIPHSVTVSPASADGSSGPIQLTCP